MATVRKVVQLVFVVAAAVAGVRLATGASLTGIERYCPFGGLETAWSLITAQRFSCATGELNVSLFLAVVLLALIARKSFCSWICPVGTVHEWLGRAAGWVRRAVGARRRGGRAGLLDVPARTDRRLRWLRVVVLVAVLAATGASGELLFRPCDPFYVLFSFHGHDVEPWSYVVLALLLGAGAVVAMAWCRYLCPLGVALWPFSRIGLLRIRRDSTKCTDCGLCDRACPHGLQASSTPSVVSGECTLCLECRAACPAPGSLNVSAPTGAVLPTWLVPVALVVLTTAGVAGGRAFALPSYSHEYGSAVSGESTTVTLVVQGVRCVDTAAKAAAQLDGLPGVFALVAYASRNQLKVDYVRSGAGGSGRHLRRPGGTGPRSGHRGVPLSRVRGPGGETVSIRTLLLALLVLAIHAGCDTAALPADEPAATEEPAEPAPVAEVATFAVPDLDEALGKQLAATVGQDEGVVSAKPELDKGHFLVTFTPGEASPDAILTRVRSVSPEAQLEGVAAAAGGAAKKGCGGCPSKSKCPKARAAEEAAAAAAAPEG